MLIVSETTSEHIPYPWQQISWQRIQQQIAANKTPHALLISGQQGIGKWHFAQSLADYFLCLSPRSDLACGQCRSCQLVRANTHPDRKMFVPEGKGKNIKIDQIRELSSFVAKTSQQGGRKVILLGPVEQLNMNSANALLKSLEEPAGDTVLILMTHVLSAVMPTIRSRCQLLPLSTPSTAMATQWLQGLQVDDAQTLLRLAGGAPLIAKEMVEGDYLEHLQLFVKTLDSVSSNTVSTVPDIVFAGQWLALSVNHITEWWMQIIHTLLSQPSDGESSQQLTSGQHLALAENNELGVTQYVERILTVGRSFNRQWLFKFNDKLLVLRQQQLQGANPNMQLLIEELLIDWQIIVQRS